MTIKHDSPAMVVFHKGKRLHWDPRSVDLAADPADWLRLTAREQDATLQLCALFLAGEEAVTHDLSPLLLALRRRGGRTEDEMFLTQQLYEESKHFEFFERWLSEIVPDAFDVREYYTPSYQILFFERLPQMLEQALLTPTNLALAQAAICYHLIIEGTVAETGYYSFAQAMQRNGLFPGLLSGVQLVQRDEARHIAFGLYLIGSLVSEEPDIWPEVVQTMSELLYPATSLVAESLDRYGGDIPFGLDANDIVDYAMRQYSSRYAALERLIVVQNAEEVSVGL